MLLFLDQFSEIGLFFFTAHLQLSPTAKEDSGDNKKNNPQAGDYFYVFILTFKLKLGEKNMKF